MAALAVLTLLTWIWAIADSSIPRGIFFLFGVVSPVVVFILFLSVVVGNMNQGGQTTTAPPSATPDGAEEARGS
jgi:hypothetical protein